MQVDTSHKEEIEKVEDGQGDNSHWGGFRIGDEVAPLEGDASSIMQAIAPVANQLVFNPQTPQPKGPQLTQNLNLQMAPPTPGMGPRPPMAAGGGNTQYLNTPANVDSVHSVKSPVENTKE